MKDCGDEDMYTFVQTALCADLAGGTLHFLDDVINGDEEQVAFTVDNVSHHLNHPLRCHLHHTVRNLRSMNIQAHLFTGSILVSTLLFHIMGRRMDWP